MSQQQFIKNSPPPQVKSDFFRLIKGFDVTGNYKSKALVQLGGRYIDWKSTIIRRMFGKRYSGSCFITKSTHPKGNNEYLRQYLT